MSESANVPYDNRDDTPIKFAAVLPDGLGLSTRSSCFVGSISLVDGTWSGSIVDYGFRPKTLPTLEADVPFILPSGPTTDTPRDNPDRPRNLGPKEQKGDVPPL